MAFKRLTAWVTGVGGVSSALAVVTALFGNLTGTLEPVVVASLLGGAAFVLAAGFIGIAMLASSDIRARGEASAARNHARADVASAFMAGTAALCEPPVELAGGTSHTYVPLTDMKPVLKAHEATARIRTTSGPGFHRIKKVSEDDNFVVMPNSAHVAFKDIVEVSV